MVERLLAGPAEGRRAARASLLQVGAAAVPALAPGQKRTIPIAGSTVRGNVVVRAVNADPVSVRPEP